MQPTMNKRIYTFLAIFTLIVSQLACKTITQGISPATPGPIIVQVTTTPHIIYVTPTPGPTGVPTPIASDAMTDDEISAGIQLALDLYAQAYNDNNPDLLTEAVDQENKPFRRIVRSRFDDFQQSYLAGQFTVSFTLLSIQRREMGYVIAHFEDEGGWYADWPFRYTDGHWVLTEPTVEQIGEPVTTDTEYFTFITYPWNDDVNGRIMEMMQTARQEVESKLGKAPTEKAKVRIAPIYGLDSFGAMGAIAWYSAGGDVDGGDLILVYAPNSYAYSYYDPHLGWDGMLQLTLTHEYTHMAHARSFDSAGRLADWMSEGLAEYVSGVDDNISWACHAYRDGAEIPILDESGAVAKQDLMHMTNLQKDTGLAYAYSHALVAYVVSKHGGLEAFWKLAESIDATSDFKKAVQATFGISYDEFNRRWQTWLKGQC